MRPVLSCLLPLLMLSALPGSAAAFCGFYVARAEATLFNEASQVVLARDGERTVLTMASDYKGDVADFAMVVPVPEVLTREQINVGRAEDVTHLDRYTAPRLVEYHDQDPCRPVVMRSFLNNAAPATADGAAAEAASAAALGVRIEARYSVGEYDILILSAEESDGLVTWLDGNGYRLPPGASEVVASYLARDMRFFVARVNLEEHARSQRTRLRPLQMAYESRRFMLPIRLGMLNANGPQELFVYTLTRKGRVETSNYPTRRLPTGVEIPVAVRERFGEFYTAMFRHQAERHGLREVFLEYAWDMGWCDPCAADPLSPQQLRSLGAYWVQDAGRRRGARDVFVTRLHLRYDAEGFPEDLMLQETRDRSNFQGRYVIRHPFTGEATCAEGRHYLEVELPRREATERDNLARLTGWTGERLDELLPVSRAPVPAVPWWQRLWNTEERN
jgi:hypothetical protein